MKELNTKNDESCAFAALSKLTRHVLLVLRALNLHFNLNATFISLVTSYNCCYRGVKTTGGTSFSSHFTSREELLAVGHKRGFFIVSPYTVVWLSRVP